MFFPKDSLFASSLLLCWNLFVTYWEPRYSLMTEASPL